MKIRQNGGFHLAETTKSLLDFGKVVTAQNIFNELQTLHTYKNCLEKSNDTIFFFKTYYETFFYRFFSTAILNEVFRDKVNFDRSKWHLIPKRMK